MSSFDAKINNCALDIGKLEWIVGKRRGKGAFDEFMVQYEEVKDDDSELKFYEYSGNSCWTISYLNEDLV